MPADLGTDLTIPPDLATQIQAVAQEQHRHANDVVSDAMERYLNEWRTRTSAAPRRRTPAEAAAHMMEARKGNVLPEGVTIRTMLDEGRV